MIIVSVNDEKKQFDRVMTVAELLLECGFMAEKVAVAVNAEFIPRSAYASEIIKNNDQVDVLAPVQGG